MSCPRCQEGSILNGEPTGTIQTGLLGNSYFSPAPPVTEPEGGSTSGGSPPDAASPKKAVLLLTDAFGLAVQNCKLIADDLAKELGCDVWVPDYFLGKPLLPADVMVLQERAGDKVSIWDWIRFIVMVGIPNIPTIIGNRSSVVDGRLEGFIHHLKETHQYERIGAVGYCFGGSTCIRFGRKPDLLQTVVICHPGTFSLNDVKQIKVPNAWVCAEDDIFFANSLRENSEAEMASRKEKETFVDYEFKVYKGTVHGFAARPNLEIPEVKAGFEGAFQQTVQWFKKTL